MDELWRELIEYARWTASPHNVQAWKIKILSEKEAELFYVPERLLPNTDPTGCFTMTGFAMFVENLSIAANPHGFKVGARYYKVPLDSKKSEPTPFARLSLEKTTEKETLDRELILKRRTSRLAYSGKPVEERVLRELESIAKKYGQKFIFSSDPELVKWVMDLNRDTLFYDMADEKSRNEIGALLRFSKTQAYLKKDGLWAYCMNFPGWLMYLFFQYEWLFELPIIKQIVYAYYMKTMSGVRTIGWLQGPFRTPDDWLNSGHMLGRLWLTMTKNNVYLHPFGSIITNEKAHERLRNKFKTDESKEVMWLIMRLGYSKEPPRSLRLSTEDILIT